MLPSDAPLLPIVPMLVESAIGNVADDATDGDSIDWLDLTWIECRNRFARKRTRGDREVRFLLRIQQSLKHGDVLGYWPNGQAVVVNLLPADVLLVRPRNAHDLIAAAFQVGNLHLPMELLPDSLLVPHHCHAEAVLVKHSFEFEPQQRRFQPTHWPDSVQISPNLRIIRRKNHPV